MADVERGANGLDQVGGDGFVGLALAVTSVKAPSRLFLDEVAGRFLALCKGFKTPSFHDENIEPFAPIAVEEGNAATNGLK